MQVSYSYDGVRFTTLAYCRFIQTLRFLITCEGCLVLGQLGKRITQGFGNVCLIVYVVERRIDSQSLNVPLFGLTILSLRCV